MSSLNPSRTKLVRESMTKRTYTVVVVVVVSVVDPDGISECFCCY